MIDTLLGDLPAGDWRMYTPVLRAKASEWKALAELRSSVRRRIAPIIEFIPDWDTPGATTGTRKPRTPQTPGEYVKRMLDSSVQATPSGTRSFVYFGLAGAAGQWKGIDLWSAFDSEVPGGTVIPLVDLSCAKNSPALIRALSSRGQVGVRIEAGEINPLLATRIRDSLQAFGIAAQSAHLFLDLKDVPAARSQQELRAALGNANAFASVVVLAGVFPMDLTHYTLGVNSEARGEWQTWWGQHVGTPAGERMLNFGDYTTQWAHYRPSPDVSGSVSLRYTTDAAFLVFRGSKPNGGMGLGHEQMHGHCRLLVSRADYSGAAFSSGDQRIHCWMNPPRTGNFEQWRTASIVHHITQVVIQLQDPVGSTATVRAWARAQAPEVCR